MFLELSSPSPLLLVSPPATAAAEDYSIPQAVSSFQIFSRASCYYYFRTSLSRFIFFMSLSISDLDKLSKCLIPSEVYGLQTLSLTSILLYRRFFCFNVSPNLLLFKESEPIVFDYCPSLAVIFEYVMSELSYYGSSVIDSNQPISLDMIVPLHTIIQNRLEIYFTYFFLQSEEPQLPVMFLFQVLYRFKLRTSQPSVLD